MLSTLKRYLNIDESDTELVQEQFRIFVKQVPLLYFILCVNALAIIHTFAKFDHPWIGVYFPGAMVAFCVARGFLWWRRGGVEFPVAVAARMMRATTVIAGAIAILFTLWGFTLYSYGDPYAKAQVVFFLGLTMIGCTFCLSHLRPAALIVAAIGVAPYTVYFSLIDEGHFRVVAIILALVGVGMVAIILRNYDDFSALVESRRALMSNHQETLRLSEDNRRLANQDPLTGLANRRAFIVKLMELSSAGGAPGSEVAMAFLDLDGFKNVNDDYGHEIGDSLIAQLALSFAAKLPKEALLARLGGDEFAALMSGTDARAQILAFAQAVGEQLRTPFRVEHHTVKVGASIGVATAMAGECDGHELLRRADVAMYHVKGNGKFGLTLYSPDLDLERRLQAALKDEILAGIERGEFDVFYQPIVDSRSGEVASVEALLRWPRRPGGAIGPDRFIPVAEAEGLIEALGEFALRRACKDFRALEGIGLSVNVSPAQFRDPEFEKRVATILDETGFPPLRLTLEVTEGYLIDNPKRAATAIAALRSTGITVALDDFGTGYTSVAYLQKYGFSAIKIDRSLISRIAFDSKARVLVTGVVYIANGLDMLVTAEGVETEEQALMLKLAGCHSLQGFYFHRPAPMSDLLAGALAPPSAVA